MRRSRAACVGCEAGDPMSERETALNGCACAHTRVKWRTEDLPGGMTRGWWECDSGCGTKFAPVASLPPNAAPQTCEWRREGNHVRPGCRPRYAWPVDGEWRACPYCTLPLVLTPAEEPK